MPQIVVYFPALLRPVYFNLTFDILSVMLKEGFIKVLGGKVWYKIVGENKRLPLIVLHGGPGYPHYYLEPLEDLSSDRLVIFYDQLGCGKSDKPDDTSLWTVERFVLELEEIVETLKLKDYHILGHSWGAALGVCFALKKPLGLKSLILSNSYLSTPIWMKDAARLKKLLSKETQKILAKHENNNTTDSEEYKNATQEFYKRFIDKGLDNLPEAFIKSGKEKGTIVYNTMWGSKECFISGNLKNFDLSDKLSQITIPALLLCGRFDEATPEATLYFKKKITNSQMEVFENSAHNTIWTEQKKYIKTVKKFLDKQDS